jgi:hypothetical protein
MWLKEFPRQKWLSAAKGFPKAGSERPAPSYAGAIIDRQPAPRLSGCCRLDGRNLSIFLKEYSHFKCQLKWEVNFSSA